MNELALFAGAGGGILATHAIGIRTTCAVELDWYCRCILVRRQNDGVIPPFPIWDDIYTFDGRPWAGSIDLISGGFPCQAFSTAPHGHNTAVDLWPEMFRVIKEINPKYVFAENVSKQAIKQAANDCATLGYKTEMLPLSAKDLGADHIRNRYWLLAYANNKSQLRRHINAKMAELPKIRENLWSTYPNQPRIPDGMAHRMEQYKAIGNGQLPIVAVAALWTLVNT